MEIADAAERFSRGFHRVAAKRAVHMEIDKTRRKIISVEINDLMISVRQASVGDRSDLSFFHDNLKPIANSIGKNQTGVRKDHRDAVNPACTVLEAQSK